MSRCRLSLRNWCEPSSAQNNNKKKTILGDVHQQGPVLRGDPGVCTGPGLSHQVTHRQVSHHARLQVSEVKKYSTHSAHRGKNTWSTRVLSEVKEYIQYGT